MHSQWMKETGVRAAHRLMQAVGEKEKTNIGCFISFYSPPPPLPLFLCTTVSMLSLIFCVYIQPSLFSTLSVICCVVYIQPYLCFVLLTCCQHPAISLFYVVDLYPTISMLYLSLTCCLYLIISLFYVVDLYPTISMFYVVVDLSVSSHICALACLCCL